MTLSNALFLLAALLVGGCDAATDGALKGDPAKQAAYMSDARTLLESSTVTALEGIAGSLSIGVMAMR